MCAAHRPCEGRQVVGMLPFYRYLLVRPTGVPVIITHIDPTGPISVLVASCNLLNINAIDPGTRYGTDVDESTMTENRYPGVLTLELGRWCNVNEPYGSLNWTPT